METKWKTLFSSAAAVFLSSRRDFSNQQAAEENTETN